MGRLELRKARERRAHLLGRQVRLGEAELDLARVRDVAGLERLRDVELPEVRAARVLLQERVEARPAAVARAVVQLEARVPAKFFVLFRGGASRRRRGVPRG